MRIQIDIAKSLRRKSRNVQMPQGGRHGTKRGANGFTRKRKHKKPLQWEGQ